MPARRSSSAAQSSCRRSSETAARTIMIQKIVAAALRMPLMVFAAAALLIVVGLLAYKELDIEAYPNTVPLEIGLSGMPGLEHIRSQSLFALSDVKCYFDWNTAYLVAKQEVINRIQFVSLPTGLQAELSPWNAIGEVYRYRVVGKGYTLKDLKTAEDWILERQFKTVQGVIDVTSYGGETKQYHVEVD